MADPFQDAASWLFGPQSIWGQITQPPNFLGTANQGPFNQGVDEQQRDQALTGIRYMEGLSPAQRDYYLRQVASAGDQSIIDQVFEAANQYGQAGRGENERSANIASGLQDIQGLEDQYKPMFQDRLNRYNAILTDPNKLRSDAEFAGQLAQSESLINNQVGQLGKQLSLRNAQSGVRSSGKTGGELASAQLQGTGLKSQNIGSTLQGVTGFRNQTENDMLNFDTGLMGARNQVRGGGFADLLGLQGLGRGTDFTGASAGLTDLRGLNLANQNQNFSNFLGATGLFMGGMEKAGQGISQLPPFRSFTNYG